MTKNKTSNKTYFHETWLSDSKFMEWIVRFKKKKKKKILEVNFVNVIFIGLLNE